MNHLPRQVSQWELLKEIWWLGLSAPIAGTLLIFVIYFSDWIDKIFHR